MKAEETVRIKKFNNGDKAILCNECNKIVLSGGQISKEEWESMEAILCKECEDNIKDLYNECE